MAVGSGAEGERYQQSRRDPTRNDEYRRSETRGRGGSQAFADEALGTGVRHQDQDRETYHG
ncbi:MAG TPA: hypothetical protein VIO95_01160, partial [Mycobacterium sp.]